MTKKSEFEINDMYKYQYKVITRHKPDRVGNWLLNICPTRDEAQEYIEQLEDIMERLDVGPWQAKEIRLVLDLMGNH